MGAVSADAFLLPVGSGFRFFLLRLLARRASLRGCLLQAPPFAEELNKSRRMITLAAERIAAASAALFYCSTHTGIAEASHTFTRVAR
ncbi:MAG: hypothetical protein OEN48_07525 [Betaproteobacteria bacterium]|nr:hypothetical protein [Gammaproteobacteria bacterium]MDH3436821.1 hypothetical protein [Betaproteobacteria bacterium]